MTPNQLEVLLHYHVSPTTHPRSGAPAVLEAVEWGIREGLLEPAVQGVHPLPEAPMRGPHQTTAKGAALVQMLCDTPLPVKQFVDPRTLAVITV